MDKPRAIGADPVMRGASKPAVPQPRPNLDGRVMRDGDAQIPVEPRESQTPQEKPRVVCLCGSTRFYEAFQQANYDLTMKGEIVLPVGFYPHSKAKSGHGEGVGHDSAEKIALDELHKRKIDLCDYVFVLNVDGYIGSSTASEIDYAIAHGKPVSYLEREPRPVAWPNVIADAEV